MNGRSWSRLPLMAAVLCVCSASALAAATVDIDSFDLPPGKSVTIEFEVTVDSPMPPGDTQVCNQGTLTATNPAAGVLSDDPDVGGVTDPTCTTILLVADLSVTKTDGATTEVPGTPVTYTIVAANAGPATVADGVVTDTFPAALSGCTWTASVTAGTASGFDAAGAGNINDTGITMAMGGQITYSVTCNIDPAATGSLANTVSISSASTSDPTPANNSATDTDTLVPSSDVAISKTDGATTEVPGTTVTYTLVASNNGPSTATGVTVADTFPGILSSCSTTSAAAGGATGNDAGPIAGNINDSGITLPPSASVTYTATCTIAATATGSLANTATISSATTDSNAGNNSATDTDTLDPQADLSITKTDGVASEVPGTPVTYTITVLNNGPSQATGVTVTDTFPGILSGCSTTSVAGGGASGNDAGPFAGNINDSGITLPLGILVTYTSTCNIDGAATGSLANTASVSTSITDPNAANNSSTDTDTLVPSADVAIVKSTSPGNKVPGTPVTYTIAISNSGPSTAAGVTVTDTFPGILTGCSTTSVAAGGATGNDAGPSVGDISDGGITLPMSGTVTYTATCNIDPAATGSLANTASVSSSTTDPNSANNSSSTSNALAPSADVQISKSDGVASVSPGASTVYTIIASNNGPSTATGVTVADTFPAFLTGCSTTSVAAGGATGNDAGPTVGNINDGGITLPPSGSVTYSASCTVDPGASGTIDNTATVSTSTTDPNSGNNSSTDSNTVQPLDYGDAPTAAQSGFAGSYPVTQAQDGARHVTLGLTLGAERDNEGNGQPTVGADGDDTTGTPDDEDGVTFSPMVACQNTSATANVSGAGRLSAWIDWNRDGDWADAGEQVATDQVVAAGDNSVPFTVPCDAAVGTTYARFRLATATGLSFIGQAANGEVEDYAVTVTAEADLSITKNDGLTSAVPGSTAVVYTIVVNNAGPSPVAGVSVTDNFPVVLSCGWTSVAAGGATGNTNNAGPANLANTLFMPVASSVTYTVTCTINASATGTLANTATVATTLPNTSDPNGANNSASDTNTVLTPLADMAISKTDGATDEVPGTSVTYTIVASNVGPSTATGVTVADTFPGILSGCSTTSVAAGGASGNDAGPTAGNINDGGITLPPGAAVTYTATCNIDVAATGSLSNTATITGAVSDPNGANNSATDTDTLTASADVSITKTDGATDEVPGTSVTYTIAVANAGPSTATGVTVADTFPGILTGCSTTSVVAGGATGNEAGPTAGNINDSGITLPPSATVTYTATCNIDPAATGSLANTATVTATTSDPSAGNNTATDTDTLTPSADVAISKTDGATVEVPGTPVTYTIVASNSGPSTAVGVTVADTFPGILSGCSTTSVVAGGATGNDAGPTAGNINDGGITLPPSATVTYTATCNIDPAATGSLANTATVTATTTDPSAGNNSATDTDTLAPSADVAITKTDGVILVAPGDIVVYTIVASNAGPSTATAVTVADTFVAVLTGCSTTSVAAGGASGNDAGPTAGNLNDGGITMPPSSSVTYTATCTLDLGAAGNLVNTATITTATTDPNNGNNSATDTDTIQPQDYGDAPTAAQSGFASSYPTTSAQNGARHGTLGVTLGALRDSETNGQPTAGADGDDATETDDEDGVTFGALVACQATSATVTASAPGVLNAWLDFNRDGDWADTGEQIATNQAAVAGPNTVNFTVPCDASIGGSFARFRIASTGGLSFTGQAADGEVEDHAVTITKLTDLAITKISDTNPVAANQIFNYEITVENIGPSNSIGFTVTDTLPAATSAVFQSAVGTGWVCPPPVGLTLTCTHGALAAGVSTATLTVQMQVAAVPSPPNFTNTATVTTTENDPVAPNNTDSVEVSTDTTPPTIDNVDSNEGSGDGELAACETVRGRVNEILIQFSEPMVVSARAEGFETEGSGEALAVGDADDVASYLLVQPGGNATFNTTSCAGGVQGDDIAVFLTSATYQANTPSAPSATVTLAVTDHGRLQSGLYRFIACGSLRDLANNALGADLVRDFRVDAFNLLANGHFDCGQAPWQAQDAVFTASADYQASPHSGAMRATQDGAFVDQCVALGALSSARETAPYDLHGRLRLDPLSNTLVAYGLTCVFFDGAACTGNATPATGVLGNVLAPTGSWLNVRYRFQSLPAGALSARCGFDFDSISPFTAEVDALNFRGNGVIFEDGFESGNTNQWLP